MADESFIVSSSITTDPERSILHSVRKRILGPSGVAAQLRILEVLGDEAKPIALLVTGSKDALEPLIEELRPLVRITPNSQATLASDTIRQVFLAPDEELSNSASSTAETEDGSYVATRARPESSRGETPEAVSSVADAPVRAEPKRSDEPSVDHSSLEGSSINSVWQFFAKNPLTGEVLTLVPQSSQDGLDVSPFATPAFPVITVNELSEPTGEFIMAPKASAGQAAVQRFSNGGSTLIHQLRTFYGVSVDVIDRLPARNQAGLASTSIGAATPGALLVRMAPHVGEELKRQSLRGDSDLWVSENKAFERLITAPIPLFTQPPPNALFDSGTTEVVNIEVKGGSDQSLLNATVTVYFGYNNSLAQVTNSEGVASFRLPISTLANIPAIVVEARSMHWNRLIRNATLKRGVVNRVRLKSFLEVDAQFQTRGAVSWGVEQLGLLRRDEIAGEGVRIGVIDSGCDATHEFLGHVVKGYDFGPSAAAGSWKNDDDGHGTHVAGIVGARSHKEGWTVRGVAPRAELCIYKVFPDGKFFTIAKAIQQAILDGVDVLNMSLGSGESDPFMAEQIQAARDAGIACIVAAGNSSDEVKFPAYLESAMAITAIGLESWVPPGSLHENQIVAELKTPNKGFFSPAFTCLGSSSDFAAPGVAVISTFPGGGFKALDGTSMAAPHVAGLAALYLAHDSALRNARRDRTRVDLLHQRMRASVVPLPFGQARSGAGLPVFSPAD